MWVSALIAVTLWANTSAGPFVAVAGTSLRQPAVAPSIGPSRAPRRLQGSATELKRLNPVSSVDVYLSVEATPCLRDLGPIYPAAAPAPTARIADHPRSRAPPLG